MISFIIRETIACAGRLDGALEGSGPKEGASRQEQDLDGIKSAGMVQLQLQQSWRGTSSILAWPGPDEMDAKLREAVDSQMTSFWSAV
ncbi:MAG: hypothetical protein WBL92_03275 [Methanothrix sp.]